jgi:hypothetical protein
MKPFFPTLLAAILAVSTFSTATQAQQAIPVENQAYTLTVKAPNGSSKQMLVTSTNQQTNFKNLQDNSYIKSCSGQLIELGNIETSIAVKVVQTTTTQMFADVAVSALSGFDEKTDQGCKVQIPRISDERKTLVLNLGGSVERVLGYEFSAQRVK